MAKPILLTVVAMMLAAVAAPLLTPAAVAQSAEATFEITGCETACVLTLTVTSPVDVAEYQVAITTSSTVTLDVSQASLTGFMAGSTHLVKTDTTIHEHRWFNLQSQGGTTGSLTVPISGQEATTVTLEKIDLRDAGGNRIEVAELPREIPPSVPVTTVTQIVTSTTTRTAVSTVTSTTTATATSTTTTRFTSTVVSTTTRTATSTTIPTRTRTVTSTSTATATETTLTTATRTSIVTTTPPPSTTTVTSEVSVGLSAEVTYAAVAFAVIAVIAAAVLVTRKRA